MYLHAKFEEGGSNSFWVMAKKVIMSTPTTTTTRSYRRWAWTHSHVVINCYHAKFEDIWSVSFTNGSHKNVFDKQLGYHGNQFSIFILNWLCHMVPFHNVLVHTKFEEIWSVSFQMAAKRMFLVNNLVTMATSFEFLPKLTLPHCAPPQCACLYQIWRDLVSKFSNGSQKNVFGKQLGYHGNQFWIFT